MPTYDSSIDVAVPVRTAYDQWTQLESFPWFMAGVETVRKVDDTTTHWVVTIGGVHRAFDARVVERIADDRIAWRALNGPAHAGMVTFHPLDDRTTRVRARLELQPRGFTEWIGGMFGSIRHRLRRDLTRFKGFIETRGLKTGGRAGAQRREFRPDPVDAPTIGHTPGR